MVIFAAIPSLLVGLVLFWSGRRRLAFLVGLLVFLVVLVALLVWSSPITFREWTFVEP